MTNNLFEIKDLPLTQFASSFAQGSIWLEEGMEKQIATFDLTVRDMPAHRNFLVYGGLEELVEYIKNLHYSEEQIQVLLNGKIITENFATYLRDFRFSGDIYAMPEGTIFFPGEPVVRVTAPIIEASLIEVVLFSITVSNVLFLSKAARLKISAKDKGVTIGMQRGHSFESGMKGLRSAYICGLLTTGWPNFVKKYGLEEKREYLISGQHFFIKSFPNELTAFKKMLQYFPDNSGFMIDTYGLESGLNNAVAVGKEMKKNGKNLRFVTIDSGDLCELSKIARKKFDENGLPDIKILAATNMNEHKIKKLLDKKAPIDFFIVATEYITVLDAPSLEIVYKMAEIKDGKKVRYTAKLTTGKTSYPGKKQVFRQFKNNVMQKDIVTLDTEKSEGTPLLHKVIQQGKVVGKIPNINDIKKYFEQQLKTIPKKLLDIEVEKSYPVFISKDIKKLLAQIKRDHK